MQGSSSSSSLIYSIVMDLHGKTAEIRWSINVDICYGQDSNRTPETLESERISEFSFTKSRICGWFLTFSVEREYTQKAVLGVW